MKHHHTHSEQHSRPLLQRILSRIEEAAQHHNHEKEKLMAEKTQLLQAIALKDAEARDHIAELEVLRAHHSDVPPGSITPADADEILTRINAIGVVAAAPVDPAAQPQP